jgi:hypothetical protein
MDSDDERYQDYRETIKQSEALMRWFASQDIQPSRAVTAMARLIGLIAAETAHDHIDIAKTLGIAYAAMYETADIVFRTDETNKLKG